MKKFKIFFLILLSLSLNASENIDTFETKLKLVKYTLLNTIDENLSIKSVDEWLYYSLNQNEYLKNADKKKEIKKLIQSNQITLQNEILNINEYVKNSEFYIDKTIDFYDEHNSFKESDLINLNSYFLIGDSKDKLFNMVARIYISDYSIQDTILVNVKSRIFKVRYYFDINDVRLNAMEKDFIKDVTSLKLDIDVYVKVNRVEIYNLENERVDK